MERQTTIAADSCTQKHRWQLVQLLRGDLLRIEVKKAIRKILTREQRLCGEVNWV